MQYLKSVASSLAAVLPHKMLCDTTGILAEHFLQEVLGAVLDVRSLRAEDRNCLCYLLSSVKTQIEQLLAEHSYRVRDSNRGSRMSLKHYMGISHLIGLLEKDEVLSFAAVKAELQGFLSAL